VVVISAAANALVVYHAWSEFGHLAIFG